MFADDTSIFFQNKSYATLYEKGNNELKNIDQWLIANKLSINIKKTYCMLFRTPKSKPPDKNLLLLLRGNSINETSCLKFLGVYIEKHLNWTNHMKHLLTKIRCTLGAVTRVKPLLNEDTLINIYHSLINSHINYCITNWCFGNIALVTKLQNACKKFIKQACSIKQQAVNVIMNQKNILNINQMAFKEIAIFMYKQKIDKNPAAFNKTFDTYSSKYQTRNNPKISTRFCYTTLSQQSISHRGPAIWNKIPTDIKDDSKSLNTFKLKLLEFLKNNI